MDYLVYNESFRLYLGYFKRATNQSSTISSVWEPLPDNCFLNISDDDEGTLEQLQCVENTFFSLGSIVEDPTVATQVDTDTNIIDMHNIEIDHRTRLYNISKTLKVFDNQGVDAHSCMVRKLLFSSFEIPTMKFRGLQDISSPLSVSHLLYRIHLSIFETVLCDLTLYCHYSLVIYSLSLLS